MLNALNRKSIDVFIRHICFPPHDWVYSCVSAIVQYLMLNRCVFEGKHTCSIYLTNQAEEVLSCEVNVECWLNALTTDSWISVFVVVVQRMYDTILEYAVSLECSIQLRIGVCIVVTIVHTLRLSVPIEQIAGNKYAVCRVSFRYETMFSLRFTYIMFIYYLFILVFVAS